MKVLESLHATNHIDEDGLVLEDPNPDSGPNTGNGLHGVGVAVCLSFRRDERDPLLLPWFNRVVNSCMVPGRPGLLHRGPRKTEEMIADDDPMSVAVGSKLLNTEHRKFILHYLEENNWSYDNLNPGHWSFRTWIGRKPGFIGHMRICGAKDPGCLNGKVLAASLSVGVGNPGGIIKDWIKIVASIDEVGVIECARKKWVSDLLKKYPKGMRDVFAEYYGPDHTFTELGVAW